MSEETKRGAPPNDADRMAVGRRHDHRLHRQNAERDLVRFGLMSRAWKDWGFENGYDDNLVPILLEALEKRAIGGVLEIRQNPLFGGGIERPFAGQIDSLINAAGQNAAALADELRVDIEKWRSEAEIIEAAAEARRQGKGRIRQAASVRVPPPQSNERKKSGPKEGTTGLKVADRRLFPEIARLMQEAEVRSPSAAVRHLIKAGKLESGQTENSTVRRVVRLFNKRK